MSPPISIVGLEHEGLYGDCPKLLSIRGPIFGFLL